MKIYSTSELRIGQKVIYMGKKSTVFGLTLFKVYVRFQEGSQYSSAWVFPDEIGVEK